MNEICIGVIPGRQQEEKLELLARLTPTGAVEIEFRLLAWGEGVGWYPQRTLPLPADFVLVRALLRRAERLSRRQTLHGKGGASVLPFPTCNTADQVRPASA